MASYKHFYSLLFASAAAFSLCTSCVDDAYDLSDMDTTVGLNVNELTIPLNVESITLDKILDIEDDSRIQKQVVNGKEIYAFKESNTFKSDHVKIPVLKVTPEYNIAPIEETLKIQIPSSYANEASARNAKPVCVFPVETDSETSFSESGDVDPAIVSIKSLSVEGTASHDYEMHINVGDPNIKKYVSKVYFNNFKLLLPKGMKGKFTLDVNHTEKDVTDKYTPKTGVLDLSKETFGVTDFDMHIYADMDAIDFEDAGSEVIKNGKFTYSGKVKVKSGEIAIYAEDINIGAGVQDIPKTLSYVCTPKIYGVNVTSFTGEVQYDLDNLKIAPVAINDLPDILSQDGTDIKLANPQVYLSINNPLNSQYGIWAEASLNLKATKNGVEVKGAWSDKINIDEARNVFCLAADTEKAADELLEEYADAEIVKFEGLGDILSGNGVPDKIYVEVLNPELPVQEVENLALGQNLAPVEGSFMFFAPLALDETSKVIYSETLDGWYDETLEKLEIRKAAVSANITSEVPANITLAIKPINVKGEEISDVECEPVTIAASSEPQPIKINLVGKIRDLDGIIINATLSGNGEAMSPTDNITMDNFKVTVSGKYIDEF